MPLVDMNTLVGIAKKNDVMLPAYNTTNMEMTLAIMDAFEANGMPGIVQIAPTNVKLTGYDFLSEVAHLAVDRSTVPMALHLDPSEWGSPTAPRLPGHFRKPPGPILCGRVKIPTKLARLHCFLPKPLSSLAGLTGRPPCQRRIALSLALALPRSVHSCRSPLKTSRLPRRRQPASEKTGRKCPQLTIFVYQRLVNDSTAGRATDAHRRRFV